MLDAISAAESSLVDVEVVFLPQLLKIMMESKLV
jgi:hypothetical protein